MVAELPVTYLHVFPYSPRPGTPAADLPPSPNNVVQARARIMRELGQAQKKKFLEAQLGQIRAVVVEGPDQPEGWLKGLSDHYLRVTFSGPPPTSNLGPILGGPPRLNSTGRGNLKNLYAQTKLQNLTYTTDIQFPMK
jgi:tRNA A37 methylthiotransferase MiaB